MKILNYWSPPVLWAGVIFLFSTMQVQQASEFFWQDFILKKTAHVTEYAILALLFFRALRSTTKLTKKQAVFVALVFIVFYGISDEYHQSFIPGREPAVRDILIDSLGGGISLLLIWKYLPKAPKRLKNLGERLQIV